jgi:ketosteroid isomerase-like protein
MPDENPEILALRRTFDAISAGDIKTAAQGLHPDIVWEHNPGVGSPEEGTYRGREEVAALFARIVAAWEHMRAEPGEISRLDDGAYLVRGELHAKHATSSTEIVTPYEQRLAFRDGLLAEGRMVTGQGLA